jgi:hypothetical protein
MMALSFAAFTGLFFMQRRKPAHQPESGVQLLFPPFLICMIFILTGLALPVLEGGDCFNDFRFYQNIYSLLCLAFIYGVSAFHRYFTVPRMTAALILLNGSLFFFNPSGWDVFLKRNQPDPLSGDQTFRMITEHYSATESRENGRRLNLIFSGALPAIGYGSAGGIAFAYDGVVYDLMGLNLKKMAMADAVKTGPRAHAAFNKEVFYRISPDILMPTTIPAEQPVVLKRVVAYYCNPLNWDNRIFKNIFNDDAFKKRYTLAEIKNSREPRYACYGFFSNAFLERLRGDASYAIAHVMSY